MKKSVLIHIMLWAAVVIFSGLSISLAAEFPYPTVAFSADMTKELTIPGSGKSHTIKGKVYATRQKERREISSFGRTTAIIRDRATDETVTLMPDQKMYMKQQGPQTHKDPEAMIRDGELKLTKMGTEKINGRRATRYKIESASKNKTSFSGFAWLTKQDIPLRFEGTTLSNGQRQDIKIIYDRIVIAKQNPALFSIPKGYRQLPTGLGGGMTPEQMEQLTPSLQKSEGAARTTAERVSP